jgi:acyl dehydratase
MTIGRVERYGSKLVMREEVIDFARQFDPQPFHLDDAAAASNPVFGRLAASGWHTAAMAMRMTVDHWDAVGDRAILGGAGLENLAWLKPVYPGDTIRCELEVTEKRASTSKPDRGIVKSILTVFNQYDEPVLRQTNVVMMARRPEASA